MGAWRIILYMATPDLQTTEVIRLRIREFNKVRLGSGVRLVKCEACDRLTDHGIIIDHDIIEEGLSGQLEKTGYERWTLCPGCAQKIMDKVNTFTDDILKNIENLHTS